MANAVFRMFQSLGGGICYIMGPLFVSAGESKSSPRQLLLEILLCLFFFLVCLVSYSAFYCLFERKNKDSNMLKEVFV